MILALVAAIVVLYLIQARVYEKNMLDCIRYEVKLSAEEVFAGDFVYLYENITNERGISIPYARVDTELPDGMGFVLPDAGNKIHQDPYIQSVFTLKPHECISRRWRVCCKKRGEYHPGSVLLLTNNLLGLKAASKRYTVEVGKRNRLVVLPQMIDLNTVFRSNAMLPGSQALPAGLLTDPQVRIGCRDYRTSDPMNRIHWKATAAKGRMMVHVQEYTRSESFHILLNMQSRDFEKNPFVPSVPYYIEDVITVAASLLGKIAEYDQPTAVIANAFPEGYERKDGENLLYSTDYCGRQFRGQGDLIVGLRLLARLRLEITVPLERMLDEVLADPYRYAPDGNLILISAFFNERMQTFHRKMKSKGVDVTFYLTTSQRVVEPDSGVEVFTIYEGKEGGVTL